MLFRRLHKLILVNQNLSEEMKRLLEIFPEGVIFIKKDPEDKLSKVWINKYFQQNIYDVERKITELRNVKVELNSNLNHERPMRHARHKKFSLFELLEKQEFETQENSCPEYCNIQIECHSIIPDSENLHNVQKTK